MKTHKFVADLTIRSKILYIDGFCMSVTYPRTINGFTPTTRTNVYQLTLPNGPLLSRTICDHCRIKILSDENITMVNVLFRTGGTEAVEHYLNEIVL